MFVNVYCAVDYYDNCWSVSLGCCNLSVVDIWGFLYETSGEEVRYRLRLTADEWILLPVHQPRASDG